MSIMTIDDFWSAVICCSYDDEVSFYIDLALRCGDDEARSYASQLISEQDFYSKREELGLPKGCLYVDYIQEYLCKHPTT